MKITTPCYLQIPICWGYDEKAFIYNIENKCLSTIQNVYIPSDLKYCNLPVTAASVIKWKTEENKTLGKVVINNTFPLFIESEERCLTIDSKSFSLCPVLEFRDSNNKILFSMEYHWNGTLLRSSDKQIKYKIKKVQSTLKGYTNWKVSSRGQETMVDYRLILGYVASSMMDTGTPG